MLCVQEEKDRKTLSLVGLKEKQNERPLSPQNKICKINQNCLNCCSSPLEKKNLYEQFKIACLQYKPSDILIEDSK